MAVIHLLGDSLTVKPPSLVPLHSMVGNGMQCSYTVMSAIQRSSLTGQP